MLNGFINLRKPPRISSNKALSILKRALIQNNIAAKVGHFGTLDPDAEGVLPVALGRATRLFDYFLDKKKVYYAVFRFGIETDTLDASGAEIARQDITLTAEDIKKVLPKMHGIVEQLPPAFSAKKINGKKAYELARKGVEFELKTKNVTIYSIELLEMLENNVFSFRIVCSGGTYIRSIARDMAKEMGTIGIMQYLCREKSGIFDIKDSISLEHIEKTDDISKYILPMDYMLSEMPRYDISEEEKTRLLNGLQINKYDLPDGFFAIYTTNGLCGIARDDNGRLWVKTWLL
jgi:tRNA pseudouridine55 synthase